MFQIHTPKSISNCPLTSNAFLRPFPWSYRGEIAFWEWDKSDRSQWIPMRYCILYNLIFGGDHQNDAMRPKISFLFSKVFFSKRTCSLIRLFDECEGFRWNLVNERGYHRVITRWKHNIRVHPHVLTIEVWRLKIALFCDSDNTYSTVSVFDIMYDAKNGCEAPRWVNIVIFHSVLTYMCSTHKYQLRKIPTPEPPRRVISKRLEYGNRVE